MKTGIMPLLSMPEQTVCRNKQTPLLLMQQQRGAYSCKILIEILAEKYTDFGIEGMKSGAEGNNAEKGGGKIW